MTQPAAGLWETAAISDKQILHGAPLKVKHRLREAKCDMGSGIDNKVLTLNISHDKEFAWLGNLGFILRTLYIMSSPEGTKGSGSFMMIETLRPIFRSFPNINLGIGIVYMPMP